MARNNKDSKPVKQQKAKTGGESTVHPLNYTPKTRVVVKQEPVCIAPGFEVHPRKASRARRRLENWVVGHVLVLHPEFLRDCRLAGLPPIPTRKDYQATLESVEKFRRSRILPNMQEPVSQ